MQCSVVIPCHNGAELTRACVQSLLQQTGVAELEILLVDNASRDDTAALAGLHPAVRVLRQAENRGFAGGVNQGLRAARHPLVLVLNNDTQAATNLLAELGRALASDPAIAAAAPVSNHVKGPARLPVGDQGRTAAGRAAIAAALADPAAPALQDVDSLAGLGLLVRRSTFARHGGFDERFGHGNYEDDDFSLRLRLAGHRLVIARRAFLHHEGHATFRQLGLDLPTELQRRRAQFVAKWQHDPAGAAVVAAWRGDPLQAGELARAALAVRPAWPDADWHLAAAAARRGDPAAAAAHCAALLRQCPRHSDAAVARACHLLAAGDEAAAARQLAWAAAHCHLNPDLQAQALARFGEHALRHGRAAAAAEQFAAALQLQPRDGALHNGLGAARLASGDLDAAVAAFRAAIEHGCDLAHTNLGIALHRRGEIGAARQSFATAAAKLPHDPLVQRNLQLVGSGA